MHNTSVGPGRQEKIWRRTIIGHCTGLRRRGPCSIVTPTELDLIGRVLSGVGWRQQPYCAVNHANGANPDPPAGKVDGTPSKALLNAYPSPIIMAAMRFVLLLLLAAATAQAQQPAPARHPATSATRQATTRPAALAEAHRIVFLVDATRVGVTMLTNLKEEMNLAVDHLREEQMFTIIVSRPRNLVPRAFRQDPIRATPATKE